MKKNKIFKLCLVALVCMLFIGNVNADNKIKKCDYNNHLTKFSCNKDQKFDVVSATLGGGSVCKIVLRDQNQNKQEVYITSSEYCSKDILVVKNSSDNKCYLHGCEYIIQAPAYNTATIKCGNVENIPKGLPTFTSNLLKVIMAIVPVILIILGIFDFVKAMTSSEEKNSKEAASRFIQRIIAAIIVFLVVVFIKFVVGFIDKASDEVGKEKDSSITNCINCFVNGECK